MNNKKIRIVKKDGKYCPQYLKTRWVGRYRRWVPFTYEAVHVICSGFVDGYQEEYKFSTKLEAIHFIRLHKLGNPTR